MTGGQSGHPPSVGPGQAPSPSGSTQREFAALRAAVENLPFDFFALDSEQRYVLQNQTCRNHWGDLIGKKPGDACADPRTLALWDDNNRRALRGEVVTGEVRFEVNGALRVFHNVVTAFRDGDQIVGVQGINIDVTETRRLQEQLTQVQKMEAVGALAAGVAHDFNNLLTGILGHAFRLEELAGLDPRIRSVADAIAAIVERAQHLTRQLLGLSRREGPRRTRVDINQVLRDLLPVIANSFDARIRITLDLAPSQVTVLGDPDQLAQVFLNLAVNASDAMPDGGSLEFITRGVERSGSSGLRAGRYVQVQVRDSGTGIPQAIRDHIFEPFFTTKDHGGGLGLAVVFGIVRGHQGTISLSDSPGPGSTFEILLPGCETLATAQNGRPDSPPVPA